MSIKNSTTSPPDKQAGLMVNDPEYQFCQTLKRWQQELKTRHYCQPIESEQAAQPVAAADHPDTHGFGREAQNSVIDQLTKLGYRVQKTSHQEHFDLIVRQGQGEADHALKIEVKGANWTKRACGRYGRYQANLRANKPQVFILACKNGTWHHFIIPARLVKSKTLTITSYDVNRYRGRYAAFLEAWELVDSELAAAPPLGHQLALPLEVV